MKLKSNLLKISLLSATLAVAAAPADAAKKADEGLTMTASLGLGYDSNAYLTPKAPYNDLAQPGNPLIVPKVQSGLYIPVGLGAKHLDSSGMEFSYKFASEYYLNSALRNASTYNNDAKLGWHFSLDGGPPKDSDLYVGFLAGYHKNIYTDRDTGEAKLTRVSGTNISNRYTHFDIGGEAKLKQKVDDVQYELATKLVRLSYNDPIVIAPLDHNLFELGASARFPLGDESTKLKLGYDFAIRDYTNRPARDALGVQSRANPLLTYLYHTAGAQLFHKFSRNFLVFLDYERTYRIDRFVNYNGYTKDKVKLRVRYHVSPDFMLRAKVSYSRTNYPHAFAFDNPAGGQKKYKALKASVKAEYESYLSALSDPVIWAKADYIKQTSTDLRYTYNQDQVMIGSDWKF
ncbi:MAG TPA: hypothetical protein VKA31_08290 [Mariprofundaceae bacterium]|nr:hypothetical protein [Mariprofundaceae bacterium]